MDAERPPEVYCADCETRIDPPYDDPPGTQKPCPECGGMNRQVDVDLRSELSFHVDLGLVARRPGFKSGGKSRPFMEQKHGKVLSADGVWRERHQVVDRENKRYTKVVLNPDGTVVKDLTEPLPDHTDAGSNKPELRAARAAAKRSRKTRSEGD